MTRRNRILVWSVLAALLLLAYSGAGFDLAALVPVLFVLAAAPAPVCWRERRDDLYRTLGGALSATPARAPPASFPL